MWNIIDKIIEMADKEPERIAIYSHSEEWSYKTMLECIRKKAKVLNNVLKDEKTLIGIVTDESPECLMNITAILYIGCGYVPIDSGLPIERMKYIIKDAGLHFLITSTYLSHEFEDDVEYLFTEQDLGFEKCQIKDTYIEPTVRKKDDVVYIMYTSGSTGTPKGVIVEERNIETFAIGIGNVIDFSENNIRFLASTSFCFDISILETLITLSYGATCILLNKRQKMNPIFVANYIKAMNVNTLQFTPTYLSFYMKYNHKNREMFKNIEYILIGGERFPENTAKELREITNAKIYNCYGPTETTIWATVGLYEGTENTGIGNALNGYTVWIDETTKEICIGGSGVARGYLNKPLQSEAVFQHNEAGDVYYRTGDFGWTDDDGNIHFHGRKDRQVKVKGFRIELNEIEYTIERCTDVEKAAVIVFNDSIIVCCYQNRKRYNPDYFIERLRQKLPTYMIPQQYIALNKLPETLNGKTNYDFVCQIAEDFIKHKTDTESKRYLLDYNDDF